MRYACAQKYSSVKKNMFFGLSEGDGSGVYRRMYDTKR